MTTSDNGSMAKVLADDLEEPIRYIQRTRAYYLALGYASPYRWAHFDDVPFARLAKPLSDARLALVTTAAEFQPGIGDQGARAPYNAAAKFYAVYSHPTNSPPDLRIAHLGYDRTHTSAADGNSYFPLARLQEAVAAGRVGALSARFHGVPTTRSQRDTLTRDGPEILRRCRADGADAVLLVAN